MARKIPASEDAGYSNHHWLHGDVKKSAGGLNDAIRENGVPGLRGICVF
jgi:hypothetical protein